METAFQMLAGWFVADLLGGVFHFFIDHQASATLWLTRSVVADFREHHDDRLSMEKYSRLSSLLASALAGVPFAALAVAGVAPAFCWTVFVGLCLTQHAHKYAHSPTAPRWARLLQQVGLFISPAAHERHHGDFHRSYGVFNGWSHGTLDLILGRNYRP